MIMKKMNFRQYYFLLGLILVMFLPFACSDDDNEKEEPVGPVTEMFEVKDITELLFTQEEGTQALKLSSNVSWTAVTDNQLVYFIENLRKRGR